MLRNKPMYNNQRLVYVDPDGIEHMFYCDEVTTNKQVAILINQPVKDAGARFITDSGLNFEIDAVIMQGEKKLRILNVPEIRPMQDNNSRRGKYRKVKVIVTS